MASHTYLTKSSIHSAGGASIQLGIAGSADHLQCCSPPAMQTLHHWLTIRSFLSTELANRIGFDRICLS